VTTPPRRNNWLIALTLVAALLMTILPLPDMLARAWPEWTALVLLYWCMALPHRVSVGTAWIMGLPLDALRGSLLGQHGLGLALITFITVKFHHRLRVYPLWQQAFVVMILLALDQLLMLWIKGVLGEPSGGWRYWMPSLTGALVWPFLFLLLRELRRYFRVA